MHTIKLKQTACGGLATWSQWGMFDKTPRVHAIRRSAHHAREHTRGDPPTVSTTVKHVQCPALVVGVVSTTRTHSSRPTTVHTHTRPQRGHNSARVESRAVIQHIGGVSRTLLTTALRPQGEGGRMNVSPMDRVVSFWFPQHDFKVKTSKNS